MVLRSMPKRYQTPAAALCALLLGAAWLTTWGWRHEAVEALAEREMQRSIAVATGIANGLPQNFRERLKLDAGLHRPANAQAQHAFDVELAQLLRGQHVANLRIYDAHGNLAHENGIDFEKSQSSQDAEIRRALQGEGFARLVRLSAEGQGERDYVESFVPFDPGQSRPQDGVIELRTDVGAEMGEIHREAQGVFANANLVALILFAVALMILRRAEEEQRRKDAVTGLPGREAALVAFDELRKDSVPGSAQAIGSRRVGWVLVSLRRLPQIGAAYGHKTADDLVREAARRLQKLPYAEAGLFRLAGDAFAFPVAEVPGNLADDELAARIAYQVQVGFEKPFFRAGQSLLADPVIGIALGEGNITSDDLLNRAQVAIAEAARRGSEQWVLYTPGLEQGVRDQLAAIADLREAWEQQQFLVYYQPLVASDSRRWVGCEALLRWRHPERGLIQPEMFVPVLEETGLILVVGLFVMREACRQMAEWRTNLDADLVVSVNLSARQFADPDLLEHLRAILAETRLPAEALVVEVTETFLAMDADYAARVLADLRQLGVAVAIDDFGVGYSSLSALRHLPVDILKIDRSFVSQAPSDPIDASIAEAIAALARGLHLTLVAEGVETEAQASFTRNIGCQKHQGYLFARPLDAAAFAASYPRD